MTKLNSLTPKLKTLGSDKPSKKKNWGKGRGGRPWRRLKQKVHKRDNHTCQSCGAISLKLICDHIIPTSQGGTDDLSNLQSLCQTCSDKKTHKESQGGGYQKV